MQWGERKRLPEITKSARQLSSNFLFSFFLLHPFFFPILREYFPNRTPFDTLFKLRIAKLANTAGPRQPCHEAVASGGWQKKKFDSSENRVEPGWHFIFFLSLEALEGLEIGEWRAQGPRASAAGRFSPGESDIFFSSSRISFRNGGIPLRPGKITYLIHADVINVYVT